jgi:hypothetical protein
MKNLLITFWSNRKILLFPLILVIFIYYSYITVLTEPFISGFEKVIHNDIVILRLHDEIEHGIIRKNSTRHSGTIRFNQLEYWIYSRYSTEKLYVIILAKKTNDEEWEIANYWICDSESKIIAKYP